MRSVAWAAPMAVSKAPITQAALDSSVSGMACSAGSS